MKGVRHREDTGFEGQCEKCRQWWPLEDREAWPLNRGFRRCRACENEASTAYVRQLRIDKPEMRAAHRAQNRENAAAKRGVGAYREYQRRWYAENHVRLMAENAERNAINAELAGKKTHRSSRIETTETLAYRADFRRRWIEKHGPVVSSKPAQTDTAKRAKDREWMRAYRARRAA